MLTADQFDVLPGPIIDLYEEYMQSVINDIARRLAGLDYATDTAAWQMQRLTESGAVYEHALKELAKVNGKSEAVLKAIFEKAGVKAMKFDDAVYKAAGLKPLPLNLSPAMVQVLAAGLIKTQGIMRNLTLTTAISGRDAFIKAADLAYMQIAGGAFDYQSALKAGIKQMADQGLTVIGFNGRRDHLDVALRRAVLTGIGQTTGQLQWTRADEMGQDLVQTSAHAGARNHGTGPENHQSWQGKIFSRSGKHPKYPSFIAETGYGTGEGLGGYNCRHSYFPFFEGISQNAYDQATLDEYAGRKVIYNKQEMSWYDATQVQRGIERKIRKWKRREAVMKAGGINSTPETEAVLHYQEMMRDFIRQMNKQLKDSGVMWKWQRQPFREQVYG